jgi:hypothetical protein
MWYNCLNSDNVSITDCSVLNIHKLFVKGVGKKLELNENIVTIDDSKLSSEISSSTLSTCRFNFAHIDEELLDDSVLKTDGKWFSESCNRLIIQRYNSIFDNSQLKFLMNEILRNYSNNIREILTDDSFASVVSLLHFYLCMALMVYQRKRL